MIMKVNVINFMYIHVLCPFINCNRILKIMINYVHKYRNWRNNINSHISFVLDLFQQSALWSQLHVNKYHYIYIISSARRFRLRRLIIPYCIHTKKPTHFVKYFNLKSQTSLFNMMTNFQYSVNRFTLVRG